METLFPSHRRLHLPLLEPVSGIPVPVATLATALPAEVIGMVRTSAREFVAPATVWLLLFELLVVFLVLLLPTDPWAVCSN